MGFPVEGGRLDPQNRRFQNRFLKNRKLRTSGSCTTSARSEKGPKKSAGGPGRAGPRTGIRCRLSDATKPYEFIGFGAMDVTKPYEFIGFGPYDVTKPYEFIGFGPMKVCKIDI
jgi:hypothetical protein